MDSMNFQIIYSDIKWASKAIAEYNYCGKLLYDKMRACYCIQQAVEKLIKIQMYLSNPNIPSRRAKTHDLQKLVDLAKEFNVQIIMHPYLRKKFGILTTWETECRYMEYVKYRIDMVENCLRKTMELFNAVYFKYAHKKADFSACYKCFSNNV